MAAAFALPLTPVIALMISTPVRAADPAAAAAAPAAHPAPPTFDKRPFEFLRAHDAEAKAKAEAAAKERARVEAARKEAARAWLEAEWLYGRTAAFVDVQRREIAALRESFAALKKATDDLAAARDAEGQAAAKNLEDQKKKTDELTAGLAEARKALDDFKAEIAKARADADAKDKEAAERRGKEIGRAERALAWLKERVARPLETVEIDGVEFVRVPAGAFTMGSTAEDVARLTELGMWSRLLEPETPARRVEITRPFLISRTEITQARWEAVMGANPSAFKDQKLPVDSVTWDDAVAFAAKLSERTGGKYRLPTEAEWEYAARAGDADLFGAGSADSPGGSPEKLGDYAWGAFNAENKPHPPGEKKANAWGLVDTIGNVWEWTADAFDPGAYKAAGAKATAGVAGEAPAAIADPRVDAGPERVFRGGCWALDPVYLRPANRGAQTPAFKSPYVGFRLVRELPELPE